jgi:hypothetical protein
MNSLHVQESSQSAIQADDVVADTLDADNTTKAADSHMPASTVSAGKKELKRVQTV